jgi:hypothetical protein
VKNKCNDPAAVDLREALELLLDRRVDLVEFRALRNRRLRHHTSRGSHYVGRVHTATRRDPATSAAFVKVLTSSESPMSGIALRVLRAGLAA